MIVWVRLTQLSRNKMLVQSLQETTNSISLHFNGGIVIFLFPISPTSYTEKIKQPNIPSFGFSTQPSWKESSCPKCNYQLLCSAQWPPNNVKCSIRQARQKQKHGLPINKRQFHSIKVIKGEEEEIINCLPSSIQETNSSILTFER